MSTPMHTVYFLEENGKLIDEPRRVAHGQAVAPPKFMPPHGRSFNWSCDTAHITQDVYCVAITHVAPPQVALAGTASTAQFRVHVLDMREGCPCGKLLPLGNWQAGESVTREDLACLHLPNTKQLRTFRVHVHSNILLTLTDIGVRAFDRQTMRPLQMMELVHSGAQTQLEAA
ncbi:MAG: hypothetical protein FWE40_01790 [Oscillospiraceae bacterium]|nr:hypothetical protein [Oscillospiraceae bacterium]